MLVAAATPLAATAAEATLPGSNGIALAAPPDETCTPGATFGAGDFEVCSPPTVGNPGPGFNFGGLSQTMTDSTVKCTQRINNVALASAETFNKSIEIAQKYFSEVAQNYLNFVNKIEKTYYNNH
jgi:hypothetical protein